MRNLLVGALLTCAAATAAAQQVQSPAGIFRRRLGRFAISRLLRQWRW